MKLISWNVNGLRACVGKDFEQQFKDLDADFFCIQETKMQDGKTPVVTMNFELLNEVSLTLYDYLTKK